VKVSPIDNVKGDSKMAKKRKRHTPEQIVKKLRDADAMLNAGKELAVVLQTLEISEATFHRWRNQYGGMKSEQAKRLKQLEDENRRLKEIVADKELDIRMLKFVAEGNFPAFSMLSSFAGLPGNELLLKNRSSSSRFLSEEPAQQSISHAALSDTRPMFGKMNRS